MKYSEIKTLLPYQAWHTMWGVVIAGVVWYAQAPSWLGLLGAFTVGLAHEQGDKDLPSLDGWRDLSWFIFGGLILTLVRYIYD